MKKYKVVVSFILAIFCVYSLSIGYITDNGALFYLNSIFSIIYILLLTYIFKKCLGNYTKREYILAGIGGGILSICNCVGAMFTKLKTVELLNKVLYLNIISLAFIFTAILLILFRNMDLIEKKAQLSLKMKKIKSIVNKNRWLFFFIFFIICWLPAFLAMFPGNLTYDGPIQIDQVFKNHQLNEHHPIIHTIFVNSCFYIGGNIFNSYNIGLMIYSLIQSIILASIFSYLCVNLLKWKVPNLIVLLTALFLGINPIIQIFVFTTAKDVLFGGFMLLVIIFITNIVLNPNEFFMSKKRMAAYITTVVLMVFMKKQGIYIVMLSVPFLIYINRNMWKKILVIFLLCIILPSMILTPIRKFTDVKKGPFVEALSVPIQQITRVMNTVPDEVNDEDKEIVYKIISSDTLKRYIPEISDPIKDNINEAYIKDNFADFVNVWVKLGVQHPNIYIDSFLYGVVGYIYPGNTVKTPWSTVMAYYSPQAITVEQNSLFLVYKEYLDTVGQSFFDNTIIISSLVNGGVCFWILVIVTMLLIYKRRYKLLIPLVSIFLFWCSLLLGPVFCVRYIFPLLVYSPFMISLLFIREEKSELQ